MVVAGQETAEDGRKLASTWLGAAWKFQHADWKKGGSHQLLRKLEALVGDES